ncbi:MAG: ankyrin repeat domain-containing protein [Spirochaetaceae bacterium]|jgi:ankyrin repeat protein|nr:ankyrin repeat domain-containing protein [Spirochaetaceae bacterium]
MKLLVLHEAEGKEIARGIIREQLKGLKVSSREITIDGGWAASGSSLGGGMTADARVIAVITGHAYESPWFAYFAGLCRGRGQGLIAYSGRKAAVPKIFAKTVIPLAGKKDLEKRLPEYIGEWAAGEKTWTAKRGLLDMGIPFSEASFCGCVTAKNAAAVNLFLQAGFSANTRDSAGVPLICLASRAGDRGLVEILLKAGCDANALSADRGGSALIDCALGKYCGIAELLLKAGAGVNVKSKDGQSALIISVGLGDEPFVELLLKAGANTDEPDALGASARTYAMLFNKPGITELLKKYAAK